MIKKIALIPSLIFVLHLSIYSIQAQQKESGIPSAIGYVNDFEGIFSDEQISNLLSIIVEHEKKTSNEIVIVTIDSYLPFDNLFDYSLQLANEWGVGKKGKNNGVMIVFGEKIREIRIQVGYGLEEKLTDVETKRIIDNVIIPEFKKGDFYKGLKSGLNDIIKEIN